MELVLPLKLKCSRPRSDLRSTNRTASAASWMRWLCLSLHQGIPKGWNKNNPTTASTASYCRALSSPFTCSHSKAKCLNTSESLNHLPCSPSKFSVLLCLTYFVLVQPWEAPLFPLKITSAPRGCPSPWEQHKAPLVTQEGRAHRGWSTTVTSSLFPHFWSHVSDKERLESKLFRFSQ